MAGLTTKLICGPRTLNLNSGRYAVADFAPPGVAVVPLMGGQSSGSRRGRSKRGATPVNRAWQFGLHIRNCSSPAEVTRAVADLEYMLSLAGDDDEPLRLFFKPDTNVAADPLWGQSGYYYEIAHAEAPELLPDGFYGLLRGEYYPNVRVRCELKPEPLGRPQVLASALGGILEDRLGTGDGQSRGLQIPIAMTNLITNPVFGHATPLNGWMVGGAITATANYDARFVLPGARASAKLVCDSGAGTTFTQSITFGDTNPKSFYAVVKLEDGSAVSSSQVSLRYAGSSLSTTVRSLGDGFYMLTGTATGVASAQNTGVIVSADNTVYLCGYAATSSGTPSIPWGDLLGCSWSGTPHASSSTRVAGRVRIPIDTTVLNRQQGAIRMVWMPDQNSAGVADYYLFVAGGLVGAFEGATQAWLFYDGTTSLKSAATAYTDLVPVVLYFTWGNAGRAIYINGVLVASTASFTPPAQATFCYIGSDSAGANQARGTFLGFDIYPTPMTAAEVLADYTNVAPVATAKQRVSAIPWLWTKDGDNVVDNTDAGSNENWCAVGGIPGSAPAETLIRGICSGTGGQDTIYLSLLALEHFFDPSALIVSPAGVVSVTGSDTELDTITLSAEVFAALAGREIIPMVGGNEDGANTIYLRTKINPGGGYYYSDYAPSYWRTISANRSLDSAPPLTLIPNTPDFDRLGLTYGAVTIGVDAVRVPSATANFNLDSIQLFVAPRLTLINILGDSYTDPTFVINGLRVHEIQAGALQFRYEARGEALEFEPNKINLLFSLIGLEGVFSSTGATITYTMHVHPRYALL
ncbi:MAG: hypothetical protein IT318_23830 [Anaerolineales bacterium]|nr:hypothetical protein [Anaerolineales bacterium]